MKKTICLFIMVFVLIFTSCTTFATDYIDDEDDEDYYNEIKEELVQTSADLSKEPSINSKSAIVIDRESKRVLYAKNINEKKAMASTTKIMTCILALEKSKLDEEIIVSKNAAKTGGSTLGLYEDDKITMNDLLYGLMLCSGNDAAVQIAETIGGSVEKFSILMNKKAKELGLTNTHFVTPHGLDDEKHYTTAYELAILTDYALKNKTFAKIVNTKEKNIVIDGKSETITNTNELLGYMDGVNGVKTGYTSNAGRCLVINCKRDGLDLISVVLGADTKRYRTKDSMKILEYAFSNYSKINLREKIKSTFDNWLKKNIVKVIKGKEEHIQPILEEIEYEYYPVKQDEADKIDIKIEFIDELNSPVIKNTEVGNLEVNIGKNSVANLKLIIPYTIKKKEVIDYWYICWRTMREILFEI